MKNKGLIIALIVFLSIITISILIIFISLLNGKTFKFGYRIFENKASYKLVLDKEYENIFDEVKIESKASDIEVNQSKNEQIRVVIYGNKDKIKLDIADNKLYILSNSKTCKFFCFNKNISKIKLYVPSSYDKKLIITNNYGDIRIDEFNNINLDIKENLGDIKIKALKSGIIKNDLGNIEVLGATHNLKITQNCGDIKINEVDDVDIKNSYGDVNINKINSSLNIKDDSGDIEIGTLYLKKDSTINSSYGDIEIGKTNQIYIDAKTSLGDTKIRNNYQNSDVTLNIKNNCGDIEVNN